MTVSDIAIDRLAPGFADPARDSQRCFRTLLDAMARPGRLVTCGGELAAGVPLSPAATAAALCLFDLDTPVWLDAAAIRSNAADFLRFHCGCPMVGEPAAARFAVIAEPLAMPPVSAFDPGSDEYPDRSASLIIEATSLLPGHGLRFSGPGIEAESRVGITGLPEGFWHERNGIRPLFPKGIDLIFTCGTAVVAVPRTTIVME